MASGVVRTTSSSSVGARHPGHRKPGCGLAPEGSRDRGHGGPRLCDQRHRDAQVERAFGDQSRGAGLHGLGSELVPVGLQPGDAEEEVPGLHLAAVIRKARDLRRRPATHLGGNARSIQ